MSEQSHTVPYHAIRKLLPTETSEFRDHLLRLSPEGRRLRFAHAVSDSFLSDYAARMCDLGSIVFGYFDERDVLRAAAELRKLGDGWSPNAEAAFSVEETYQERGLGTLLMGRVIRSARNRGVTHLYISCLAENAKMLAIARKYDAKLSFESGEVIGDILPPHANYFSQIAEAVDDRIEFMMAVLEVGARSRAAA